MAVYTISENSGGASGVANVPGEIFVADTATVSGDRDGTREAPYSVLDFLSTVPTTQAEYNQLKRIVFLDSNTYTLPSTIAMGRYQFILNNASVSGNTTWEINSAERFGSSTAPEFNIEKNNAVIPSGWSGTLTIGLKSGGSAVSILYLRIGGIIMNNTITIADGTNGGTSCASTPIFSMYRATIAASGVFLGRNAICSLTQSTLAATSTGHEFGYLSKVESSTISSTSIMEARSSTLIKTVRDFTLNTSGSVTWNSTGSVRNWNVDVPSANEIKTKITSYPANAVNLTLPGAISVGVDDTAGYFDSPEDVETALEQLADGTVLARGKELAADPSDPPDGSYVIWQSNGTGSGDDGDIMMKISDSGGTVKTATLVDYSAV